MQIFEAFDHMAASLSDDARALYRGSRSLIMTMLGAPRAPCSLFL
jgi:hypothetical protein